jgi:hypothetical protein
MVLSLDAQPQQPQPAAAHVQAIDSWCQRMQVRRQHAAGPAGADGGAAAAAADARAHVALQRQHGVFVICGGEDDPCAAPSEATTGNVVPFPRGWPASTPDGRMAARTLGVTGAAAGPPPPHAALYTWPASQAAQAALPPYQHGLAEALANLQPRSDGRYGAPDGTADDLGDAVAGLRQLQSIVLDRAGGSGGGGSGSGSSGHGRSSSSSRGRDAARAHAPVVEALRCAFSPLTSSQEEEAGADDDYAAAIAGEAAAPSHRHPASASLSSLDLGSGEFDRFDLDQGAYGYYGYDDECDLSYDDLSSASTDSMDAVLARGGCDGVVDPLVEALLSDDCAVTCAYVHAAISSCSSGEYDGHAAAAALH